MKRETIFREEKGVVIVVALLLLLVLTLIGISAINTTSFESIISGNERTANSAFYASEAGIHVGLRQIPTTTPIANTTVGQDETCSGTVGYSGLAFQPGFSTDWEFKRYQVDSTGRSFGSTKDLQVQVSYGPFSAGTQY